MIFSRRSALLLVAIPLLIACGSRGADVFGLPAGGSDSFFGAGASFGASGGVAATGGRDSNKTGGTGGNQSEGSGSAGSGGRSVESGGGSGTGGAPSGGTPSSGGMNSTGGAPNGGTPSTGGTTNTGGVQSGGTTSTGGTQVGGSSGAGGGGSPECFEDVDCDDGVDCTEDACLSGACSNSPRNDLCDNGLFCDGEEFCDADLGCQSGTPPDVDDGVSCTDDSCDEDANTTVHVPNHVSCNGATCDGTEYCDMVDDCQTGAPPSCDLYVLEGEGADIPATGTSGTVERTTSGYPNNNCAIVDSLVNVDIDHSSAGDLLWTVVQEDSSVSVDLYRGENGDRAFGGLYSVSDSAMRAWTDDFSDPFDPGFYLPTASETLADFLALEAASDWTLEIVDQFNAGTGTLNGWSMYLQCVPARYSNPAIAFSSANDDDTDTDDTIGWEFTVGDEDVVVTALSFYDEGLDGLAASHPVGIYEAATEALVVSTTVPAGSVAPLDGQFRYVGVPETTLSAQTTYRIAGYRPTGIIENIVYNVSDFSVSASIMAGAAYYKNGTDGLAYPDAGWSFATNGFYGPNMKLR